MHTLTGALASLVVGIAAALVIVAIAILPFLSPAWVGFEQGRAQAAAWTGYSEGDLRTATDAILADLVIGPPDFDVAVDGVPVLTERERGHMRDVRGVFAGFYLLAIVGAVVLVGAFLLARGPAARARLWRRLGLAGRVIAVATVALGIVGVLFFDTAFEVFHELFFPAGSFLFDPGDRPPRPAVPGDVLGRDDDRRGHRDHRAGGHPRLVRRPSGTDPRGTRRNLGQGDSPRRSATDAAAPAAVTDGGR